MHAPSQRRFLRRGTRRRRRASESRLEGPGGRRRSKVPVPSTGTVTGTWPPAAGPAGARAGPDFHRQVACRSTPCTDSQYPSSMALHLTFIMAIGLPAAERLDPLNGTFHACCTIDSDALPVPGLFTICRGFRRPAHGPEFHSADRLLCGIERTPSWRCAIIFANSLIWWLQARIVYVSTRSAPQFDRSPHEGAPCATMSTLTY